MNRNLLLLLTVAHIFILAACQKTGLKEDPTPPVPYDNLLVNVRFPDGMNINYSEYSLFSLGEDSKVDASGSSSIAFNNGSTNIAWLFDKENNLVMAGFVNETATDIDAASTAKVLLYYYYSFPIALDTIKNDFVSGIGSVNGVGDWINTFTNLLKNDRLVVSNGTYMTSLTSIAETTINGSLAPSGSPGLGQLATLSSTKSSAVAIRNADITVYTGDVKSGLQVFSEELNQVKVTNFYQRRAHAFFYKTSFKDLNGVKKNILQEIGETTPSDRDEAIDPTGAINSFTGVVGAWIEQEGDVIELAAKTTDPMSFPLQDNESEATYKVRIVGGGNHNVSTKLTSVEKSKLFRLEMETLALDFLVPLLASEVSSKISNKASGNLSESQKANYNQYKDAIVTLVEEMIKGTPAVYDKIKEGKYKEALNELLKAIYAGNTSVLKEPFMAIMAHLSSMAVQEKFYVRPSFNELVSQNRMMKILEVTDKLLEAGSYVKMLAELGLANCIDDWELLLKSGKVTLMYTAGSDSVISTAQETKIKAEIKNMNESGGDQHPFFEWSTTGKYGKLADTKGHSGKSFSTADFIVSYQSTTNSSDLKDPENIDYIYVKASHNNVLIGMDTIKVTVKKSTYEMKPVGPTVTGKQHKNAANEATLYLAKVITGQRDIPGHESLDFKIEWSTSGTYGSLVGPTTTFNDDDIKYKATSEQIGIHTETITAVIYAKNKGENDYFLYDQIKGTVKIDNEDKKKIIWRPREIFHGDDQGPHLRTGDNPPRPLNQCWKGGGVSFDPDPEAKSYSVQFDGQPTRFSWNANQSNPSPPLPYVDAPTFTVIEGGHLRNSLLSETVHVEDWSVSGGAVITIYLK